ncbi:hypothetical protein [Sphingobacterium zeae]|uniref:hypothetical protein n=1 Tax=Sphingobacterium zeae TaxID=1776859 RepID=UPI003623D871
MRSGAKIGSLQTNFQAFCSYLFHFVLNCLEGWEILFRMGSPGAILQGRMADKRSSGRVTGERQLRSGGMAREAQVCGRHAAGDYSKVSCPGFIK